MNLLHAFDVASSCFVDPSCARVYSESHCDPALALYTILLRSTFSRSPSSTEGNSRALDRALAGSTALSVVVFLLDLVIYSVVGVFFRMFLLFAFVVSSFVLCMTARTSV